MLCISALPAATITRSFLARRYRRGGYENADNEVMDESQSREIAVKVVLNEKRDGLISRLYIKSFKEGEKANNFVMSVVVDINNKPISISTSQRRIDQILAKIKMADSIPYLKGRDGGASPTHGTGSSEPPLPGTTPRGAGTARTKVPADTLLSPNSSEKSIAI